MLPTTNLKFAAQELIDKLHVPSSGPRTWTCLLATLSSAVASLPVRHPQHAVPSPSDDRTDRPIYRSDRPTTDFEAASWPYIQPQRPGYKPCPHRRCK